MTTDQATTTPTTTRSPLLRHGWRAAFVASGVLLAVGGPMHPSSDAKDDLRTELATMTADDSWVTGHSLIVASTVLLAIGLWAAYRGRVWPDSIRRPLLVAAVAVSVYVFETIAHLAAVVDSQALADGEAAPVAMSHIGMSIVLYPITGWAIVWLAWSFGTVWGGWRWAIAALGIISGLMQAFSVPLTILLPDGEFTPLFAGAAMTLALFAILTGVVGASRKRSVREPVRA